MISHKHKFIFIHVPKCGGTSIERFFLDMYNIDCNWSHPIGWWKSIPDIQLQQYMIGKMSHVPLQSYSPHLRDKYFTFSFVRNPWSRVVSKYRYFNINTCFKKFVFDINCEKHPYVSWHFKPQNTLTHGCDFIGRFETLQQDFDTVCNKIGIPPQQLPHENKTVHKHYTEYYDDETREIVAEKYAQDITLFRYSFGSVNN